MHDRRRGTPPLAVEILVDVLQAEIVKSLLCSYPTLAASLKSWNHPYFMETPPMSSSPHDAVIMKPASSVLIADDVAAPVLAGRVIVHALRDITPLQTVNVKPCRES